MTNALRKLWFEGGMTRDRVRWHLPTFIPDLSECEKEKENDDD